MMKGISLELYRVFWEIGKTGNLTRAAEKLYVSQPNISVALKTLENQLQATLCIRTKKGVTLTQEGEVLFNELEKAFSHIRLAETKIEKLVHLESGRISISAGDTICNYYLLPYITRFTRQYPGIRLEITNRTSRETVALLKTGQVDIGFINLPYVDKLLSTTVCCKIHDVLVGGSRYKELAQTEISIFELSQYPLVMLERKSNSRLCIDHFFEQKGIVLSPVLELGSLDLVLSFVKNNMGLAFIPMELCGQFIDQDTIFPIGLKNPLPARGIGLIELAGATRSRAVEQFKKSLFDHDHCLPTSESI